MPTRTGALTLTVVVGAVAAACAVPVPGAGHCALFPPGSYWYADIASGTWEGGPIGIP